MTRLLLLSSPLLGPSCWAPLVAELARRGVPATVSSPPERPVRRPGDVLAGFVRDLRAQHDGDPGEPPVLVPHSNAGLFVAALAAAGPVAGTVFLDAGLPSDTDRTPLAPAGFVDHLRSLVPVGGGVDDLLPPWRDWWPGADLSVLYPDDDTRSAVESEQARLPLGYFTAQVASPPGWADLPTAHVGFGEAYAAEHDVAVARGWPAYRLAGEHLHHLVAPGEVAEVVLTALRRLGLAAPAWEHPERGE